MGRLRCRLLAALAMTSLALSITTASLWVTSRDLAAGPVDGVLVCQLDRKLPDIRFEGSLFGDVIDFYRDVVGADILVDWPALAAAGVHRMTPVQVLVSDEQFGSAMAKTLRATGANL